MAQVTAIVGSLRKQSVNRAVFEAYQELNSTVFELKEGSIADIPLYNQDIVEEPPAVTALAQQLDASQGVIFFSPEYNYSIPGALKNAIDWLSRSALNPFDGKAAAIIGASPGNIGTARMQYHLRQVGVFLNLRFLNKPEVMIGQCGDKIQEGKLVDERARTFLQKHAQAFVDML